MLTLCTVLVLHYIFQDAGYGEKYFFTPENEDDSDDQVTIEDEVSCFFLMIGNVRQILELKSSNSEQFCRYKLVR